MTTERTAIFTSECKECFFSIWTEEGQTGCKLGKLERYKDKGLVEESDGHFVVKTFCNSMRDDVWAEQYNDPENRIREETSLRYDVILFSYNKHNHIHDLKQSIKSINRVGWPKPRQVIVSIRGEDINHIEVYNELQNLSEAPLQVVKVIKDAKSELEVIDAGFSKVASPYYVTWEAGELILPHSIGMVNEMINVELLPICVVYPMRRNHGGVVQRHLHKICNGSKGQAEYSIFDKIKDVIEDQEKPEMGITWNQILKILESRS